MDGIVDWVVELPTVWLWLALVVGAFAEYVVPPFPGDMVVLAGSVIGGSQGIGFIPVFAATTGGSVLGAWLDYEAGRWLAAGGTTPFHAWARRPRVARMLERLSKAFVRHGDIYLAINRFLPGIRAFFFVAAGYSAYGRGRTLAVAAVGAMLWNALILAVGWQIGSNLEDLVAFGKRYAELAWTALIAVVAIGAAVAYVRARRSRREK